MAQTVDYYLILCKHDVFSSKSTEGSNKRLRFNPAWLRTDFQLTIYTNNICMLSLYTLNLFYKLRNPLCTNMPASWTKLALLQPFIYTFNVKFMETWQYPQLITFLKFFQTYITRGLFITAFTFLQLTAVGRGGPTKATLLETLIRR